MRASHDPDIVDRVVTMTKFGATAARIAEIVGCSQRTIVRIRVDAGVGRPPSRPLTDDELELANRLLDDGCSVAEVERTLGRAQGALHRRFADRTWSHREAGAFAAAIRYARRDGVA